MSVDGSVIVRPAIVLDESVCVPDPERVVAYVDCMVTTSCYPFGNPPIAQITWEGVFVLRYC